MISVTSRRSTLGSKRAFLRNNAASEGFAFAKLEKDQKKICLQHQDKKPKTTSITTTSLTAAVRQLKKAGTGAANKLISFTSRHTLGNMLLHSSESMLQVKA